MLLGEERQQRGVNRAAQHGVRDGVGQPLEAVARGRLDLGVRVVHQGEEHGGELGRREGQGAPGGHQARLARRVLSDVALGLGGEGQPDFLRLSLHRRASPQFRRGGVPRPEAGERPPAGYDSAA